METTDKRKELMNEFNAILEENKKLSTLRNRYVEHAQTIKTHAEQLISQGESLLEFARLLDPMIETSKRTRIDYTQEKEEILKALRSGTHITSEWLERAYPNLTDSQRTYLFSIWMPSVKQLQRVKDGVKVRYYWDSIKAPTFEETQGATQ